MGYFTAGPYSPVRVPSSASISLQLIFIRLSPTTILLLVSQVHLMSDSEHEHINFHGINMKNSYGIFLRHMPRSTSMLDQTQKHPNVLLLPQTYTRNIVLEENVMQNQD